MSKRFSADSKDAKNWLKVLGYTILTAIVVGLIDYFNTGFDLPAQYLWITPLVNTALVAVKDFLENRVSA